jgi:hypothetical protein
MKIFIDKFKVLIKTLQKFIMQMTGVHIMADAILESKY